MTNYTSLILQIPKNENHRAVVLMALTKLPHASDFKANNPNLSFFENEENHREAGSHSAGKVSIEMVREMILEAALGIYSGSTRVMALLHADNASVPAQNSLLKLVEEPPNNTQIILTASNPNGLLPTILSRCLLVKSSPSGEKLESESPSLPNSYSAAIILAEQHKDREQAIEFVENLIQSLHQQNSQNPSQPTTQQLKILTQTLQHLHANVNVRLALEHGLFAMI